MKTKKANFWQRLLSQHKGKFLGGKRKIHLKSIQCKTGLISLDHSYTATPHQIGSFLASPLRNISIHLKKHDFFAYQSRLTLASAALSLAFCAIILRLFILMVITEPKPLDYHVAENFKRDPFIRQDIIDRNGVLLATSIETSSAFIDPKNILDMEVAARKIHKILPELSQEELLTKLKSDKRFFWLKRNITPDEHYRLHKLGLPGLDFQIEQRRIYPAGPIAAHVVGFTDVDGIGLLGVERAFDESLKHEKKPIQLSIDLRLQHIIHEEVQATVEKFNGLGGAGLLMDVNTGEVLAMVSLPDFDPHKPGSATQKEALFNRNTQANLEHGSTMKILNTAMVLESGKVSPSDHFDARVPLKVARFTIDDFKPKRMVMDVSQVYMHSSNIGAVLMMQKAGLASQKEFFKKVGLCDPVPFDLLENAKPMPPKEWRDINGYTIAYGYGFAFSPLQMLTSVSAIANGGYLPTPTIVKLEDSDKEKSLNSRKRVVSEKTSQIMRLIMRTTVTQGTAQKARVAGYDLGAKTGTGLKANGNSYHQDLRVSSLVGVFPMENPKYILYVMVDEPKGTKETHGYATGGWVAAPVSKRIIEKIGPLLNLKPNFTPIEDDHKLIYALYHKK